MEGFMRNEDYKKFMKIAIEEAISSLKEGNEGYGAVLVKNGSIIERAHNTEVTDSDPTAHAEMNLIREASKKYGRDLTDCIIFSTYEPCLLCTGAIIWAKVSEIVYGAPIRESIKIGRTAIKRGCREIIERYPCGIRIREGVLKKECLKLYSDEIRKIKKLRVAKDFRLKDIGQKPIDWFERKIKGTDIEKPLS